MNDRRIPFTISIKPWFHDHHFGGRTLLPAVETMLFLADVVSRSHPGIDIRRMEDVSFPSFLLIPQDHDMLEVMVECDQENDGRVRCKLLSRIKLKAMSRIKEHGEIFFAPAIENGSIVERDCQPKISSEPDAVIEAEQIYRELVPFGPSYRTLQDKLYIFQRKGWGRLKAPLLPAEPIQKILGSPFPLDGAMHAACVLGQQRVDFVPFPVGFKQRRIVRPTQPGVWYQTQVVLVAETAEELVFDVLICDDEGLIYEDVSGVRMRDVSGAIRR